MEPFISAPKISCLKDPYKALRCKTRGVKKAIGAGGARSRQKNRQMKIMKTHNEIQFRMKNEDWRGRY